MKTRGDGIVFAQKTRNPRPLKNQNSSEKNVKVSARVLGPDTNPEISDWADIWRNIPPRAFNDVAAIQRFTLVLFELSRFSAHPIKPL